jgi:hypothetical protein
MARFFSARGTAPVVSLLAALAAGGQAAGQVYTQTPQGYVPTPAVNYTQPAAYPQTTTPGYVPTQSVGFGQAPQQPRVQTSPVMQGYTQAFGQAPVQVASQAATPSYPQAGAMTAQAAMPAYSQSAAQVFGQPATQTNAAAQTPMSSIAQGYMQSPAQINSQGYTQMPSAVQAPHMYLAERQPTPAVPTPNQAPNMPMPATEQSPYGAANQPNAAAGSPWSAYNGMNTSCDGGCGCGQWGGGCGAGQTGFSDTCAAAMQCGPQAYWQAHAGALLFFRDDANRHTFSFDSAIETNQYTNSRDAKFNFLPGVEVGLLRWNCCCQTGWEGIYWGLFPSSQTTTTYGTQVTGNLNPILDFTQLDYNGGTASGSANNAVVHRLTRYSQINNAELNRLWGVPMNSNSPWAMRTLAGFRYLNFNEGFEFAADPTDAVFTGAPEEIYYRVNAHNNLYGGQIGMMAERRTSSPFSFTMTAKAGVYCNDASATSWIGGSAGTATINNGTFNGQQWLVNSSKQAASFIGELQIGGAYQLPSQWRLLANYRVVGVTGLALPTNQIYAADIRGINDVAFLNTNGNLFLHGVFVGAERAF